MAQYKIKTAKTIDELNSLINNNWTIISVQGEAFNVMSDKIYQIARKQSKKGNRTFKSAIVTGVGILGSFVAAPLAVPVAIVGAISLANSRLRIPLSMLKVKEIRALTDYDVIDIKNTNENQEIIICHKRFRKKYDTYTTEN